MSGIDTSIIDATGGMNLPQPRTPQVFVDTPQARADALALVQAGDPNASRVQEIDAQLASNPADPMLVEALKKEREIVAAKAAVPPAALVPQGTQGGEGAEPDATEYVDPTGGAEEYRDPSTGLGASQLYELERRAGADAVIPGTGGPVRSAMVKVGESSSTTQQLPNEAEIVARAQLEDAQKRSAELDKQQVEREVAGAQKAAAVESEKARTMAAQLEETKKLQAEVESETKIRTSKYEAALEDFGKTAKNGVDPDRYWKNASTGKKIGSAISIMLSAIGAGFQSIAAGGQPVENLALRRINDAIERDIDAQRMTLDARAKGVSVASTALQVAQEAGLSRIDAQRAVHLKSLEVAKQQVDAASAATKVPTVQEALGRVSVGLDTQIATQRVELAQSMRATVQTQQQARRVTTGGGGVKVGEAAQRARDVTGAPKFDPATFSKINGVQYADATTRREYDEKGRQVIEMREVAGKLRELKKKYGSEYLQRIPKATAEGYASKLAVGVTVAAGQGAMSKDDAVYSKAQTAGEGNPLDFLSTVDGNLDAFDGITEATVKSMRDVGMVPDRIPPAYKNTRAAAEKVARERLRELR